MILILSIIALILFIIIVLWRLNDRITALEALVECLESEVVALRRKLNELGGDNIGHR